MRHLLDLNTNIDIITIFLQIIFSDWSLEILSLCQEFSNDGVVGMDLAGDEILGEIPAMKGHVNAFKVCFILTLLYPPLCPNIPGGYALT